MARNRIWTIGHSRHDFDTFESLLSSQKIELIVDVRTFPSSKMAIDFNEALLKQKLEGCGVEYLFAGLELGGRPNDSAMYDNQGRVLYGKLADSPQFKGGIDRLIELAKAKRVAVMCSEGKPDGCHRHLLVAKVLDESEVEVIHILPTGMLTSYTEMKPRITQPMLFDFEGGDEWKSVLSVRPDQAQKHFF